MLFSQQFFLILQGILSFISQLNRLRIRIYLVENYREFMVLYARGGVPALAVPDGEMSPEMVLYARGGYRYYIIYHPL